MQNGKQWFHSDSNGLHLLFEPFSLEDSNNVWTGYLFVWFICTTERGISYCLDKKPSSNTTDTINRYLSVFQKTMLYAVATTLRLLYMLVIMYFNTNLFILVVGSLTLAQLCVEFIKAKNDQHNNDGYSNLKSSNENLVVPKIIINGNDEE